MRLVHLLISRKVRAFTTARYGHDATIRGYNLCLPYIPYLARRGSGGLYLSLLGHDRSHMINFSSEF